MDEVGARVLIVSGDRSLYRRAHCVPAGRLYEATVEPDCGEAVPGIAVRRVNPGDWPLLAPLHQSEPVRFLRTPGFIEDLAFWWDWQHPGLWLIEADGDPAAYVMVSAESPRDSSRKALIISEYAGARAAIVEALPAIFAATEASSIQFLVLGHDRELVYLLRARGAAPKERPLSGTHRLLDLPGLMEDLRSYLAERLAEADLERLSFEQEGERCAIAYGAERLDMSLSEAAPLVLGGSDAPQTSGDISRVVSAIFPIPFPMPGFNYI
jgi:hypothetical protein